MLGKPLNRGLRWSVPVACWLATAPWALGAEPGGATIENVNARTAIRAQQLTADVEERLRVGREWIARGYPKAALDALRLAQTVVRLAVDVPEADRRRLERRVEAQIVATVRAEERVEQERTEQLRREASASQRARTADRRSRDQQVVDALFVQFDRLMEQGQANTVAQGGLGDAGTAAAPYSEARSLAQSARALAPEHAAPRAGMFAAQTEGFLAQERALEALKESRFLLSMQDASRAAVPGTDTITIEYPDATTWRAQSELRTRRYGESVDLKGRDPKTMRILAKLDEPVTMSFPDETPLGDVLKYIKQATTGPDGTVIPIYVDPVGLQEADRTLNSPVSLDLEGVPLKTTLRLLLKQLGMTYTVKDGLMTITAESSVDQPAELRVYPVADLAIIPTSLMGNRGGGMGGMGGGGGMGASGMGSGLGQGMGMNNFR